MTILVRYNHLSQIKFQTVYTKLEKKRCWLFKVPFNSKIRVKCTNAQNQLVDLPTQGVLSIAPDCTARRDDKILIAHHNIQSESEEV